MVVLPRLVKRAAEYDDGDNVRYVCSPDDGLGRAVSGVSSVAISQKSVQCARQIHVDSCNAPTV